MAKYTITLVDLLRAGYNIFDDTWTTFDPEHKGELCSKIIRHYYFYEIGQETADRFKHYLNEHLSLIMPYYNQFYYSETLKLTPLYNRFIEDNTETARDLGINRSSGSMTETINVKNLVNSLRKLTKGTSDATANEGYNGNEKWREDRIISDLTNTTQNTTEDTSQSVNFTQNEKEVGNVNEVGNETMNDSLNGTKTVNGTSNTTSSNTRRYSDTPQAQIGTEEMSIDAQYLTNYTRDNGTSSTTTQETEKLENTENKVTDITKTTDTNKTTDTTSKEDTTKEVKGTLDKTEDKTINDNVTGNRDTTHNQDNAQNVLTTENEQGFSNGKEDSQSTGAKFETEDSKHKTKEKIKINSKGFTVSQAELLEAYRKTFINIDEMIIRELATDFMGIF